MLDDLRIALRGLGQNPGFAALAIVTLALGIGAGTAIFSVVNGVLLRSLPYPDPDMLMQIETVFESGNNGPVSYPDFEDLRAQNQSFDDMAAYSAWTTSAAAAGEGFRLDWANVSPGFFSIMGVAPVRGGVFGAAQELGGQRVAVVSYGYWQSRLGGTESLADQSVRVGDAVYGIAGVMPRGYDFPPGTELWVPREPMTESRTAHNWRVVGRLADGVPRDRAQQDLSAVARRLEQQHGDGTNMVDASVRPILEPLVGNVRPALLVLLGASGVLLLVACVNVANLMLARALARDRELAVRLALGASPTQVARSLLAESLLLSLAGGGLGVLVAMAGVPALLALEPGGLPRAGSIAVDWAVLAFTLGAAVLSALIIGVVPAMRAARRDMREALVDGQRIHGGSPASRRLRGALVVSQIALTVVLLIGAGLVGRSMQKLLTVDPGFHTDGATVMELWFPVAQGGLTQGGEARIVGFIGQLIEELRAIPGVERVGGVNAFPLDGGGANGRFVTLQGPGEVSDFEDFTRLVAEPSRAGGAEFRVASAGYFGAMGIPLVRGRLFDERDSPDAPHVAVVSASLAEARWPGRNPLGRLVFFGNMDGDLRPFTVVGVVGDIQEHGLGAPPRPTFYADYRQRPRTAFHFNLAAFGRAQPADVAAAARRIAGNLDPEVPVAFRTLREIVSASVADRQFILLLLTVFGGIALVLATTGVYSIVLYMTSRRTSEIGVRVAFGAQARDVVRLLVRQGIAVATVGVSVGLVVAFGATRVLASFLYEVDTADPVTYAAAAFVLIVAAVAASWVPAFRASRIDALEALRHE